MVETESTADVDYFVQARKELDDSVLVSEIWLVPVILSLYLLLIITGKKDLINKNPMDLKLFILIFNIFQIFYNTYIAYLCYQPDLLTYLYNHTCKPMDPARNKLWLEGVQVAFLFFVSKLIDLLDTVFIVLRKRTQKVSFLHLYHHVGMVLYSWIILKNDYLGQQLFIVVQLNSIVHIVMYTYYTLALMGPAFRKYLWWKKYVTILQLGQFFIVFAYMGAIMALGCPQPKYLSFFAIIQALIFFKLFKDFYDENYSNKSVTAKQAVPSKKKAT